MQKEHSFNLLQIYYVTSCGYATETLIVLTQQFEKRKKHQCIPLGVVFLHVLMASHVEQQLWGQKASKTISACVAIGEIQPIVTSRR